MSWIMGVSLLVSVFTPAVALETNEPKNWLQLATSARTLSSAAVAELESKLAKNPDDMTIAVQVMAYYALADYKDSAAKAKLKTYVFQMIERHPDAEILGHHYGRLYRGQVEESELQTRWDKAIADNPGNVKVAANAAESLTAVNIDLGITYWQRVCRMAPDDAKLHRSLAGVYQRKAIWNSRDADPLEFFEKSYDEFVFSYELIDPWQKRGMLVTLSRAALEAGEFAAAGKYADELLNLGKPVGKHKGNGDFLYCGYQIKGRLALESGDVEAAEAFLLKSIELPDNYTIGNFGPNMSLVNELLLQGGRREVVLEFFKKCAKYWKNPGKMDPWVETINAGSVPNFGSNLYF